MEDYDKFVEVVVGFVLTTSLIVFIIMGIIFISMNDWNGLP